MIKEHKEFSISCHYCSNETESFAALSEAMEDAYRQYWIRKPADLRDGSLDTDICLECRNKGVANTKPKNKPNQS